MRLRPTSERVRGAIFSILGAQACQGARVLDLYAGSGALGMEALSRGAEWADFVEVNARLVRRIRENLGEMSLSGKGKVYQGTVERVLDILPGGYDMVFADPPYDMDEWDTLMGRLGAGDLIKEGGVVVVEHRYTTAPAESYNKLVQITGRRYGDTSVSVYRAGATNG